MIILICPICPICFRGACKNRRSYGCDHFGTGSDSRPARNKVGIYSPIGPVAVAPGSKVVAVVFILQSTYCFFARASLACRLMAMRTPLPEDDKLDASRTTEKGRAWNEHDRPLNRNRELTHATKRSARENRCRSSPPLGDSPADLAAATNRCLAKERQQASATFPFR